MKKANNLPNMGVILCKSCGEEIDTVSTSKVVTYYSNCSGCHSSESKKTASAKQ